MKTKYISILVLILIAICARAAIQYIDYSTIQAPTTYTNYLLMTIPAVTTNNTVTIITTNAIVGDSLPSASAKINADFDWVETNGIFQPASLNLTNWSLLPTNVLSSGGGGNPYSISNLYGIGTNTTLLTLNGLGTSYFVSSNVLIFGTSSNAINSNNDS